MNTTFSNTFFIGLIIYFSVHFYSFAADATDFTPVSQNELSSFNADSATREYLDLLTPEQKVRSDKYFEGGYWILIIEFILEIIIAWIFLSLGLSKWIHKIALKAKRTNIQNTIYILLYLVLVYVISFPLSVYTDFIREHQFGLSNMSFTEWFSESMISFTLVLLFMGLLIVLLYMIMRKSARQWWII
jgi:STE24 endopeptidase